VNLFPRGQISDEDTHTQSHLVAVLSTTPIDYYCDGGIVRATWEHVVNTEFYSWDTSFGLVTLVLGTHVGELYSADHLGNFIKCFLQLGWGLTGVCSTHTECALHVP
jgi:hypothetical protein